VSVPRTARARGWVAGLAVALLALAAAPVAAAHSSVSATQPANDAIVQEAPDRVSVIYTEPVETAFGALRVYDSAARRVDTGELLRPSPDTVAVALEDGLPDGTYTVTWQVISADSHPIHGAFVFHIGAPGANAAGIAEQVENQGIPQSVNVSAGIVRFAGFGALILAAGGVIAILFYFGPAAERVRRLLWAIVAGAAGLLALCGPPALVLQGAEAGGFSVGEAAKWDVVSAVLDTRYGQVIAVRTVVALLLLLTALGLRSLGKRARDLEIVAGLAAAALVVTPGLAGHARVSGGVSLLADAAHVAAASIWVGGLTFVVIGLLVAREDRWPLASTCVPRFSTFAVGSVAVLLLAGVINGYLQVKSWDALFNTTYGQLLIVKVALILPLLALGAFNNRFAVPSIRAGASSEPERRRFLRMAGAELMIMAVIVGVTAALVAEPPAKAAAAQAAIASQPKGALLAGPFHLEVEAKPGTAGTNDIVFDVVHGEDIAEISLQASLPSEDIGPLEFEAEKAGPKRWVVEDAELAIAGTWDFRVQIRQGEFDAFAETVPITIGTG
jgi:copper transport protein